MGVNPGGKPGEPEPIDRGPMPQPDGLDELFADLGAPPKERAREPAPGRGWDVLPGGGAQSAEMPVVASAEDPAVAADGPADDARAQLGPAVKAAGVWLNMFARTLKTCRLYDAGNPAAVRFREELARALTQLLDQHGAVTYRFIADDVTCDGHSLYPARSREDNLAFAFFRDGVRGLTIAPTLPAARHPGAPLTSSSSKSELSKHRPFFR